MSEPTMVEQLGNHVLAQLPKNLGYDQRIKIMHSVQDFVRQWVDREQKAEWDLDLVNERMQTERDEAVTALRKAEEELYDMRALLGECYWAISRGDLRERIDKLLR